YPNGHPYAFSQRGKQDETTSHLVAGCCGRLGVPLVVRTRRAGTGRSPTDDVAHASAAAAAPSTAAASTAAAAAAAAAASSATTSSSAPTPSSATTRPSCTACSARADAGLPERASSVWWEPDGGLGGN